MSSEKSLGKENPSNLGEQRAIMSLLRPRSLAIHGGKSWPSLGKLLAVGASDAPPTPLARGGSHGPVFVPAVGHPNRPTLGTVGKLETRRPSVTTALTARLRRQEMPRTPKTCAKPWYCEECLGRPLLPPSHCLLGSHAQPTSFPYPLPFSRALLCVWLDCVLGSFSSGCAVEHREIVSVCPC